MFKTKLTLGLLILSLVLMSTTLAGKLTFSPVNDQIIKNCPTKVKILIDTEGEEINTAGINIIKNDSFVINEFNSSNGVFRTYTNPKVFKARIGDFMGQEYLRIIGTTSAEKGYIGEGEFGTLTITPKESELDLSFYMIPGYDGEDTNLAVLTNEGVKDGLTEVNNLKTKAVNGECNVSELEEMKIKKNKTNTVTSEEVETEIENNIKINEQNVFDKKTQSNFIKKYRLYIIIILVIIALIIILLTKKSKKK